MAEEEKRAAEPEVIPSKQDVEKNKVNAVLSYLGILIIVPLLSEDAKKSEYAKFHMNQGLVLLIIWVVGGFVFWIPLLSWLAAIAAFVLWVMGIVSAAQGTMKKLPIIGDVNLIK